MHIRQTSVSVPIPSTTNPGDSRPLLSIQTNPTEMLSSQKKCDLHQQVSSSLLSIKRTSDCQMTGEELRRRSSLSTESNLTERNHRKVSTNVNSSEKVVIIDTTAVRGNPIR